MNEQQLALWKKFCDQYIKGKEGISLFETHQGIVKIEEYGKNNRLILKRSKAMENLLINEVEKVNSDFINHEDKYQGLIYMMYKLKNGIITPLYIGKSEKFGKKGDNLSQNIANIRHNKSFFCRWGSNYAYHIGDLSAVVCPNHPEKQIKQKYERWATSLFEPGYPTYYPRLQTDVYFWIHAWEEGSIGIFSEFGETSLTALEYQLISVAATLFPEYLLNYEGVNRGRKMLWIIWLTMYLMNPAFYLVGVK